MPPFPSVSTATVSLAVSERYHLLLIPPNHARYSFELYTTRTCTCFMVPDPSLVALFSLRLSLCR